MHMLETQQQAELAYQQKHYQKAAQLFESSARLKAQTGDHLGAAESLNNASVAALQGGDARKALELSEGTHKVFLEAQDLKRAGMAFANQATAQEAMGDHQLAMKNFQEASTLLKQCGETDLRSYVLKRISTLQIKEGKQFEALGTISAALDNAEKLSPKERFLKKLSNLVMKLLSR